MLVLWSTKTCKHVQCLELLSIYGQVEAEGNTFDSMSSMSVPRTVVGVNLIREALTIWHTHQDQEESFGTSERPYLCNHLSQPLHEVVFRTTLRNATKERG